MPDLDDVYNDIKEDPFWDYLRLPGIAFVPGYGQRTRPSALILGEAPGATENRRLRPFCGPSGTVLDHLMAEAGLYLDDKMYVPPDVDAGEPELEVYANAFVTNVVKYRPPHNATPNIAAIIHAAPSLRAEWMALGGPRIVVCVGSVAHAAVHPQRGVMSLSSCVRYPQFAWAGNKKVWFISQFHPAYGLRKGKKVQDQMTSHWQQMGEFLREEGLL